MAIYHLNLSHGSKSGGQSASAKIDYISREGKYDKQEDVCRVVESANIPNWADDAKHFWKACDKKERANARLFSQLEFALPLELNPEQQLELVREFANSRLPAQPYTFAIHEGKGENPHVHLVYSERMLDGIERTEQTFFKRADKKMPDRGGTAKNRDLKSKEWLVSTREQWANSCNTHLAKHKSLFSKAVSIDHRTLEAQGIEREPQRHHGYKIKAIVNKSLERNHGINGHEKGRSRSTTSRARSTAESRVSESVKNYSVQLRKGIDQGRRERQQKAEISHGRALRESRENCQRLGQVLGERHGRIHRKCDRFNQAIPQRIKQESDAVFREIENARERHQSSIQGRSDLLGKASQGISNSSKELDRREANRMRESAGRIDQARELTRRNLEFFKGIASTSERGRELIEGRARYRGDARKIKSISSCLERTNELVGRISDRLREGYEAINAFFGGESTKVLAEGISNHINPLGAVAKFRTAEPLKVAKIALKWRSVAKEAPPSAKLEENKEVPLPSPTRFGAKRLESKLRDIQRAYSEKMAQEKAQEEGYSRGGFSM
jgi:hypothetical protein